MATSAEECDQFFPMGLLNERTWCTQGGVVLVGPGRNDGVVNSVTYQSQVFDELIIAESRKVTQ